MNDRRPAARADARASLAALLSFCFPGLGQAYNGDRGVAWILAVPVVLLVLLVILAIVLAGGLLVNLLDIRFLVGLIVLDLILLAWRLVAILQAYLRRERPHGAGGPPTPGRWWWCSPS